MPDLELKAVPKLSPAQLEEISDAIVDAFDVGELIRVLRFKWGLVLGNYINLKQGFYGVVGDLIDWTERRGKTRELAVLVCGENPGNSKVQRVGHILGIHLPDAVQKYDLTVQAPAKPALEAVLVRHSRFVDYGRFLSRFRALGNRVCRIETPAALGTGFLVGPDLVLTNFHVIETAERANAMAQTICRFDYHANGGADTAEVGGAPQKHSAYRLASTQALAKSPYSESDRTGQGEPKAEELDYALLQLTERIGQQPVADGNQRGWFNLQAERPLLAVRDFAIVPQHPQGRRLEVAWGSVLNFSTLGNRVRYDTSTSGGSSGAPCFTVDLEIFGLHHAGSPQFNQAIPLDVIASDLKSKNVL